MYVKKGIGLFQVLLGRWMGCVGVFWMVWFDVGYLSVVCKRVVQLVHIPMFCKELKKRMGELKKMQ